MSKQKEEVMSVRILPNTTSNPPGKLADAEVIFEAEAGPLNGLKLIGFAVWERRAGGRNVTFPARAVLRQRRAPELRAAASREWRDATRKRRFGTPSSTRTAASRPLPDRPHGHIAVGLRPTVRLSKAAHHPGHHGLGGPPRS